MFIFILLLATTCNALKVFTYEGAAVTIRHGSAYIINGHFKLVHLIDLKELDNTITDIGKELKASTIDEQSQKIAEFHLHTISYRLNEITGIKGRKRRSIDWIGSAWKWVAGSPDASDWNLIVQQQDNLVENNNHQYKINKELFSVTQEAINRINSMAERVNSISKGPTFYILGKILLLKDQVDELVRACQMAKAQIVNANLLNKSEIDQIMEEIKNVPYQNSIEAIEHGIPSVYTNGSLLLYVITLPKVKETVYDLVSVRATVVNNQQIEITFPRMLLSMSETYGIKGDCTLMSNITVCSESAIKRIPEDSCVSRAVKGGDTTCDFIETTETNLELIDQGTVFVTNFRGELRANHYKKWLNGTYVIQFENETIHIGNTSYSNTAMSTLQALPPILTTINSNKIKASLERVHNLSMDNITLMKTLEKKFHISNYIDAAIILSIVAIAVVIWNKIFRKIQIPSITATATK